MKKRFVWSLILSIIMTGLFACGDSNNNSTPNNQGNSNATYSISCSVTLNGAGLSGVTMALSGASTASDITDANGNCTFTGLANGTYTMTPGKTGHAFQPTSKTITINNANSTDNTFIATATASPTYSIEGSVTLGGAGLSGVDMVLSGSSSTAVVTDANGNYSFTGLSNGNYTLTPSKTSYTYTPASKSITINGANSTGNNFTANELYYPGVLTGKATETCTDHPSEIIPATISFWTDTHGAVGGTFNIEDSPFNLSGSVSETGAFSASETTESETCSFSGQITRSGATLTGSGTISCPYEKCDDGVAVCPCTGSWSASGPYGEYTTALTANAVNDNHPKWKPDGTKIAFRSQRSGNWDIWVMNSDGTNVQQLTTDPAEDGWADWSPDGTRIVFRSHRAADTSNIWVMNADGTGQTRLTTGTTGEGHPDWSPNGAQIAFSSNETGTSQIWVMNADGSNQTQLTSGPTANGHPNYSPDGSKVAYQSNSDSGNLDIWVMNADGSNKTQLTTGSSEEKHLGWSPDGKKIAYDSNILGNWNIWVMNADGSDKTRITGKSSDETNPDWSPDGSKIVFNSNKTGNQEIYTIPAP